MRKARIGRNDAAIHGQKIDMTCFCSVPATSYCDPKDYEAALTEMESDGFNVDVLRIPNSSS